MLEPRSGLLILLTIRTLLVRMVQITLKSVDQALPSIDEPLTLVACSSMHHLTQSVSSRVARC